LNPLVWSSARHTATRLHRFALAEHGSMLDLRLAARATPCPRRAALYLAHADDEARHAAMFAARARAICRRIGRPTFAAPRADTEHLFERLGEADFLAFIHHGERRGRMQFESYAAWFTRKQRRSDAALFRIIVTDERRHEAYTRALLVELCGGEAGARRALSRVQRWEFGRRWLRAGRAVAGPVYGVLAMALYVVVAPLSLLVRWVRPTPRGWRALGEGDD
jgi:hypothetical protein